MTNRTEITAEELRNKLDDGSIPEFWNVLTDDYFTGQLIPGSRRVPLDRVGREVAERTLPHDTEIIVYCSGRDCPQSGAAADKLTALGFTRVRAFEGGLQEWTEAGGQLEGVGAAA